MRSSKAHVCSVVVLLLMMALVPLTGFYFSFETGSTPPGRGAFVSLPGLSLQQMVPRAYGDTVTQPVTLTISPTGATPATFTVSDCNANPTTIDGDGASHNIVADPNCDLTISFSNSGDSRYVFSDGTASWMFTTCGSGTCDPPGRERIIFNCRTRTRLRRSLRPRGIAD